MNLTFFDDKPNLDEIDFKHPILNEYKKISFFESMNNLIFHGCKGCGKTIKIYSYLCSIFGKNIYDIKNISYEEDKKIMNYKASMYHIEINPIILGSNEKLFIQSFLKTYIETINIGLNIPKIIVIKNADLLTKQSQMILRKFIENNSTSKFIFEINNLSNLIKSLQSRCLFIRIPMPSIKDIKLSIQRFLSKRNIKLDENIIDDIINDSNKINIFINLKKIYGYLTYYLVTNKKFNFIYYDQFFEILNFIYNKKISFTHLKNIRDLVNDMYINLIPLNELITFIFYNIYKSYSENVYIIKKLIELTCEIDINIKKGNKECIHVEYYIISVIDILHST